MKIPNWSKFQHYRQRRPPWIRLYRELLSDRDWMGQTDRAKALLTELWMVAADEEDGSLPDLEAIAWRLRRDEETIAETLAEIHPKFLADNPQARRAHDASNTLAPRQQDAAPEESRGEKRRVETDTEKKTPPSPPLPERIDDDVDGARRLLREALESARGRHPGLTDQQILDLPAYQAPSGPVHIETCQHAALMRATAGKIRRALTPPKRARAAPAWDTGDAEAGALQARAAAWLAENWGPVHRFTDMPAVLEALAGLSPPADLAGAIRDHLIFGIYPNLRQQPQEATA